MALGPDTPFSATLNPTPFGNFDNDQDFKVDADKIDIFIRRKLGQDTLDLTGITSKVIWACFEEATFKYSEIINVYHARSTMINLLGMPTGSLSGSENRYPASNSEFRRRLGTAYVDENQVYPIYSASFNTRSAVQSYNLGNELSLTGNFQIMDVYHYSPTAAYRFFDTTSALNYLTNEFSFESYSPETVFYLLPVWEDMARAGSIETSQRVRRSNYAWDIVGNILRIFPVPTREQKIWLRYRLPQDPFSIPDGGKQLDFDGASNISNLPFGNITYSKINSLGKNWIRRYTLGLAKINLGQVRSKFKSFPIPGADMTLNGDDLIAQGTEEIVNLENSLKEQLEATTYSALMAVEAEQAENLYRVNKFAPMLIITG